MIPDYLFELCKIKMLTLMVQQYWFFSHYQLKIKIYVNVPNRWLVQNKKQSNIYDFIIERNNSLILINHGTYKECTTNREHCIISRYAYRIMFFKSFMHQMTIGIQFLLYALSISKVSIWKNYFLWNRLSNYLSISGRI